LGAPERGCPFIKLKENEMKRFVIDNMNGLVLVVRSADMDSAAREYLKSRHHNCKMVSGQEPITYLKTVKSAFDDEMIQSTRHCHWHEYRFSIREYVEEIDGSKHHPDTIQKEVASMVQMLKDISCELTSHDVETDRRLEISSQISDFLNGLVVSNNSIVTKGRCSDA
jgi:hypothetical protein